MYFREEISHEHILLGRILSIFSIFIMFIWFETIPLHSKSLVNRLLIAVGSFVNYPSVY